MGAKPPVPPVPAAFFGMVLGLAGLGNAWRAAHQVWGLPAMIGELVMLAAAIVWAVLLLSFILKWLLAREHAIEEAHHPVQCCFIGLVGVSTMLIAGAALPYSRLAAELLFAAGAVFTIGFAVWRTGILWQGDRDHAATTPVLYLPTVAGAFVLAAGAAALGHPDWGQVAFGAGFFSWLAIESVLVHRFYTVALPPALRPTLGIHLAPPAVGAVAYISVTNGPPDLLAHAFIGYGLLQAVVLARLVPWIRHQPFAASYWGFTFGVSALATAPLRLILRGETGPVALMAPYLFVAANLVIGVIALATLKIALQGRLLPAPPPVVAAQ